MAFLKSLLQITVHNLCLRSLIFLWPRTGSSISQVHPIIHHQMEQLSMSCGLSGKHFHVTFISVSLRVSSFFLTIGTTPHVTRGVSPAELDRNGSTIGEGQRNGHLPLERKCSWKRTGTTRTWELGTKKDVRAVAHIWLGYIRGQGLFMLAFA